MILSPPFLPEPQVETEAQFLDRAMQGGAAGDGGYPISYDLNWHGGIHLEAPTIPRVGPAPVRAIADGTVAFVRQPTPQSGDPDHALNHHGGWTDDGCVVIRHETAIGATQSTGPAVPAGPEVVVTFFSVTMHLASIAPDVQQGQPIYRKSELGSAGSIYGQQNRIHFEILCDDANLERLVGRSPGDTYLHTDRSGRTDVVFGETWFLLLVNTPFYQSRPQAGQPLPPVRHTSVAAQIVGIRFEGGAAITRTLTLGGTLTGTELTSAGAEYDLYTTAVADYSQLPSAGYELLRFGRVLGPDALQPPDAPRWHEVCYRPVLDGDGNEVAPGGQGWVNLNDPRVRRFSDADFPPWDDWWTLVDGSASATSQCRDVQTLELLDADNDWTVSRQEAQASLNDPARQRRLAHKICKYRTEWDGADLDARYGWVRRDPDVRLSAEGFTRLKVHIAALAFWQQAQLGLDPVHWHFHPRAFMAQFRKCGWFSLNELAQLLPRRPTGNRRPEIAWATAQQRFQDRRLELNWTLRKYNILNADRQTHFLAQTYIETDLWQVTREYGQGRGPPWPAPAMQYYTVFYGRGIMQLTWAGNYDGYGTYRSFANINAGTPYADRWHRITHASLHYWWDPRDRNGVVVGVPRRWYSRYDPEVVADDHHAACDSGGYYWVSKNTGGGLLNINRVADRAFGPESVSRISVLVNGGGYGFVERERWAAYIHRYRSDSTEDAPNGAFTARIGRRGRDRRIVVDYTPQRP